MKITIVLGLTLWIEYCKTATTPNEKAILKQMQDWGYSMFSTIKEKENESQYLVAVVVANASNPADFVKYLLSGCPAEPSFKERLLECRTSAVILNQRSKEIWRRSKWFYDRRYRNHGWHGEYRLLLDGIAERLTNNFRADNPNQECKIYLYSFFIPCSEIQGVPYSCASLITDYNNTHKKCKVTLVGFLGAFSGKYVSTNMEVSKHTLENKYLDLIQFTSEVQVTAIQNTQTEQSFQELMFNCLIVSPLSACCVDDQISGENSQLIVAYFVNAMMFALMQNKKISNSNYDQAMKHTMLEEIDNWLSENIGGDCVKCSQYPKVPRYLIYFCAQTALDLSVHLGTPENRNDLKTAKWKPLKYGKISNINMIDPEMFKNTVTLMCKHSSFSIDSLCTRMSHAVESNKRLRLG